MVTVAQNNFKRSERWNESQHAEHQSAAQLEFIAESDSNVHANHKTGVLITEESSLVRYVSLSPE